MANQIKSVAQLVLENKGKETRKRKAEELTFKKSLASSSNSINKTIHDKKEKVVKKVKVVKVVEKFGWQKAFIMPKDWDGIITKSMMKMARRMGAQTVMAVR